MHGILQFLHAPVNPPVQDYNGNFPKWVAAFFGALITLALLLAVGWLVRKFKMKTVGRVVAVLCLVTLCSAVFALSLWPPAASLIQQLRDYERSKIGGGQVWVIIAFTIILIVLVVGYVIRRARGESSATLGVLAAIVLTASVVFLPFAADAVNWWIAHINLKAWNATLGFFNADWKIRIEKG